MNDDHEKDNFIRHNSKVFWLYISRRSFTNENLYILINASRLFIIYYNSFWRPVQISY